MTADLSRPLYCGSPAALAILQIIEEQPQTLLCAADGEDEPTGRPRKDRLRILVVDDEDLFREGLALRLRTLYHAAVEEAETGSVALEKLRTENGFDLILMDVSMPDIDGDEAYKTMRALGVDIPIVLMSAHEENRAIAQELGIPFLDKPLDDAALERIFLECGGGEAS